jgi:hypothetical protein
MSVGTRVLHSAVSSFFPPFAVVVEDEPENRKIRYLESAVNDEDFEL